MKWMQFSIIQILYTDSNSMCSAIKDKNWMKIYRSMTAEFHTFSWMKNSMTAHGDCSGMFIDKMVNVQNRLNSIMKISLIYLSEMSTHKYIIKKKLAQVLFFAESQKLIFSCSFPHKWITRIRSKHVEDCSIFNAPKIIF